MLQALRELQVPLGQLEPRELLVLQAALQALLAQLVVKVLQALRELQDKVLLVLLEQLVFKEQLDHRVLLVQVLQGLLEAQVPQAQMVLLDQVVLLVYKVLLDQQDLQVT